MEKIILSVEHLNKLFKSGDQSVTILHDISFAIEEGSACAIVGPSGSGKTTLIAICAGLERPSEGAVLLNGTAMHSASEEELSRVRNQLVGFVFQSFQLLPSLTALENVMVPAEIRGENHARSRAEDLLRQVGLDARTHHYPIQLSGGEQQRVAIARAFHEPAENSLCRRTHRQSRQRNRQGDRSVDFSAQRPSRNNPGTGDARPGADRAGQSGHQP